MLYGWLTDSLCRRVCLNLPQLRCLFREQWKGAEGGKGGKVMEKVKACTSITLFCEGIGYYDMLVIDK
jgi:hypothetical protein